MLTSSPAPTHHIPPCERTKKRTVQPALATSQATTIPACDMLLSQERVRTRSTCSHVFVGGPSASLESSDEQSILPTAPEHVSLHLALPTTWFGEVLVFPCYESRPALSTLRGSPPATKLHPRPGKCKTRDECHHRHHMDITKHFSRSNSTYESTPLSFIPLHILFQYRLARFLPVNSTLNSTSWIPNLLFPANAQNFAHSQTLVNQGYVLRFSIGTFFRRS